MSRKLRTVLLIFFSAVFLFSASMIAITQYRYWVSQKKYKDAADSFTKKNEEFIPDISDDKDGNIPKKNIAPIVVDFDALQAVNSDIIGWIYCEGTPINYPLLQGATNDTYIHTLYTGEYDFAGSIFEEMMNRRGFVDNNTILYGHNMKDGSMLACLGNWQMQSYFDEHPNMWILTPTQDYKLVLFSAYITDARNSDVYAIYQSPGSDLYYYIDRALANSYVYSNAELDYDGKFVLLSTCTNAEGYERSVVHGMLVPVESVGGETLN